MQFIDLDRIILTGDVNVNNANPVVQFHSSTKLFVMVPSVSDPTLKLKLDLFTHICACSKETILLDIKKTLVCKIFMLMVLIVLSRRFSDSHYYCYVMYISQAGQLNSSESCIIKFVVYRHKCVSSGDFMKTFKQPLTTFFV